MRHLLGLYAEIIIVRYMNYEGGWVDVYININDVLRSFTPTKESALFNFKNRFSKIYNSLYLH